MRLLLVADTYWPATISGALQLRDLAEALVRQGHRPLVLVPYTGAGPRWQLDDVAGVQVLRVRAPRTKDVAYFWRVLAEFRLPWVLRRGLQASPLGAERWDGVVWYSPTIFLGPVVRWAMHKSTCRSYLILRDLFPDWAADAGVLKRGGLAHRALKAVERYQYRQADVIGVQTPANVAIVARDAPGAVIEVLHNWLAAPVSGEADVASASLGKLEGRKVFVYAGNMGVAQDLDAFVELASRMRHRSDIGFLLVGRGSEFARLGRAIQDRALDNIVVQEQVSPAELSVLLARCHAGIIALHPAHGTHNIPGKLLTYLHAGLPVLARVNPGNDLHALVHDEGVGASVMGNSIDDLVSATTRLADNGAACEAMGRAGRALAVRLFSPDSAAAQVARSFA
jgi:glycosyltransferase involved in cell wall biosynthesis